jgi:hypothetical protein
MEAMAVSKINGNKQNDRNNKASEIPKFDLAEQILAEQRKINAIRRKGPAKKTEAPTQQRKAESISYTIQPPSILSEQEQIIAEIVSRDIKKLCSHDITSA